MARYLISFDDGTMIIPEEDMPEVGAASHRVVDEAKAAGVWLFGGGVLSQRASIVATDGTVTNGPYPETKLERPGGHRVPQPPCIATPEEKTRSAEVKVLSVTVATRLDGCSAKTCVTLWPTT